MPYPNEHAARLQEPGKFDSFRRTDGSEKQKIPTTIGVIWGHKKDAAESDWEIQALRFPIKNWTEKEARDWLKENDYHPILFEPAGDENKSSLRINNKWYSMTVSNSMPGQMEIMIYDEISSFGITAKQFKNDLDSVQNVNSIVIKMNSPGGDIIDGFAIYNVLNGHPAHIVCEIDGIAASIASVIAMAADEIRMPGNAFMMIHDPWTVTIGTADQLRHDADVMDKMKKNAIAAYQTHAKDLTDDEISDLMKGESWLTAEDCLTYGLCETIVDFVPIQKDTIKTGKLKIPENVFAMLIKLSVPIIKMQSPILDKIHHEKIVNSQLKGGVMNKCPKCGKEVNSEFVCCNHCGAQMKVSAVDSVLMAAHKKEIEEAKTEAAKDAKNRVKEIQARCRKFNLPADFENALIDSDDTVEECIVKIVDKIDLATIPPYVKMGKDDTEKFRSLVGTSLKIASGLEKDGKVIADIRAQGSPTTLHATIRACLRQEGKLNPNKIDNLTAHDLALQGLRLAKMSINEGTSDFPAILADVANKALETGMVEEETTYQKWCGEGETKDFKTLNLVKLSNFGDLKTIGEGDNFERGRFSDKKETVAITTKGRMFNLSRQAIVNDDLNAFVMVPRAMVGAAQRGINTDVYDALASPLTGPIMAEGGGSIHLFDFSNHANILTGTGATVPTIASLGLMRKLLREIKMLAPEKSAKTQYTNAEAKYLITGTVNETIAQQLLLPVPTGNVIAATTPTSINPFIGTLQPVIDPYLGALLSTGGKANAWYLAASQTRIPTFMIYYLQGNRVPTIRNQPSEVGEALGIAWDIYFDWGIGLADWRGLVYCDGATA